MFVGLLNHPGYDLLDQMKFAKQNGFDYVDITLEPPRSSLEQLNATTVKNQLSELGLFATGHTAWYIPIDAPFKSIQRACADEFMRALDFFRAADITKVTIHHLIRLSEKIFPIATITSYMIDTLQPVCEYADKLGVRVMLENGSMDQNKIDSVRQLFTQLKQLYFHLDVGHAYLGGDVNTCERVIHLFGDRLIHVHISDNFGNYDLHLPLYTGIVDWQAVVRILKRAGYNDTVTLEVFSSDPDYLVLSKNKFKALWNATQV